MDRQKWAMPGWGRAGLRKGDGTGAIKASFTCKNFTLWNPRLRFLRVFTTLSGLVAACAINSGPGISRIPLVTGEGAWGCMGQPAAFKWGKPVLTIPSSRQARLASIPACIFLLASLPQIKSNHRLRLNFLFYFFNVGRIPVITRIGYNSG